MNTLLARFGGFAFSLFALTAIASAEERPQKPSPSPSAVQGQVPEGWEVVELNDAPMIEKLIELKNGEQKKILVRPFGLRPQVGKTTNFSVSNPLETASGQDMEEVLDEQSSNLMESEAELSVMLNRLKALLRALPSSSQTKN